MSEQVARFVEETVEEIFEEYQVDVGYHQQEAAVDVGNLEKGGEHAHYDVPSRRTEIVEQPAELDYSIPQHHNGNDSPSAEVLQESQLDEFQQDEQAALLHVTAQEGVVDQHESSYVEEPVAAASPVACSEVLQLSDQIEDVAVEEEKEQEVEEEEIIVEEVVEEEEPAAVSPVPAVEEEEEEEEVVIASAPSPVPAPPAASEEKEQPGQLSPNENRSPSPKNLKNLSEVMSRFESPQSAPLSRREPTIDAQEKVGKKKVSDLIARFNTGSTASEEPRGCAATYKTEYGVGSHGGAMKEAFSKFQ